MDRSYRSQVDLITQYGLHGRMIIVLKQPECLAHYLRKAQRSSRYLERATIYIAIIRNKDLKQDFVS